MNAVTKSIVTGAAAVFLAGSAIGAPDPTVVTPVRLTSGGHPLPAAPASDPLNAEPLPTADQLAGILDGLVDPDVPDLVRSRLVQGGIDSGERRAFTRDRLTRAAKRGELPLSFAVGNVWAVGPDTTAAEVTVSGPKLPALFTKVSTFVDQDGWMLSSDSAASLIKLVTQS